MPKPKQKSFPKSPYANLMTDLIFKKVFNPDNEFTKVNLINLLNDVLKPQLASPIKDVLSLDKEINSSGSRISRTSVFDLHCKDSKNRTFIVEVQIKQMEYFIKRSFFYAGQAIVRQGVPGYRYDYNFNPVYVIAISWPNLFADKRYVHHLSLCDMKTKKQNRDFASFTFLELQKFPGIGTGRDALRNWMYLFRYLHTLQKLPAKIQNGKFTRLLKLTKVATLKKVELEIYEKEVMSLEWDEYAVKKTRERLDRELREKATREGLAKGMATGLKKGMKKGLATGLSKGLSKGLAKGLAKGLVKGLAKGLVKGKSQGLALGMRKGLTEGEEKAKIEMAKNLQAEGLPLDVISRCTGFSIAKIKRLK